MCPLTYSCFDRLCLRLQSISSTSRDVFSAHQTALHNDCIRNAFSKSNLCLDNFEKHCLQLPEPEVCELNGVSMTVQDHNRYSFSRFSDAAETIGDCSRDPSDLRSLPGTETISELVHKAYSLGQIGVFAYIYRHTTN